MPTASRTANIRSALTGHLDLFAESHRKMLLELLALAEVGERARDLIAGLTLGGGADAAPAKRGPTAKKTGAPTPASAPAKTAPPAKAKKASAAPKAKKNGKATESKASAPSSKKAAAPKKGPRAKQPKAPPTKPAASAAAASGDQPPLREVLVRVMKESGTPLSVKEIEKRVLATGYTSSSSNFAKVISVQLSNLREGKRVDKGVYALKEAAPAS